MDEDFDETMMHLVVHLAEVLEAPDKPAYRDAMEALCRCMDVTPHTAILLVLAFKGGLTLGEVLGSELLLSMN